MTDGKLHQRLEAWHHSRFDDPVAPDGLRDAILAIPGADAELRGLAAEPARLSRPLILLVAAALLVSAVGAGLALGGLVGPTLEVDNVRTDFSDMNACEVLGFSPSGLGQGDYRGRLGTSSGAENTTMVTSGEIEAIRRGEAVPVVGPRGSCDYWGPDGGFGVAFRPEETTQIDALEIIRHGPGLKGDREQPSIDGATVWHVCISDETEPGCGVYSLFVSAEPYFFRITDYPAPGDTTDAETAASGYLRDVAERVLEVLTSAR